ncbi:hypothetical protein [Mesorhizobium sp.]|uniref:hypothetical protein n=1 Tax=Mesorhizobium sp. TaxID=1871066 RepID=UPI001228D36E|nr:hypothetical protein [Mesorhizobium sp.]TIO11070.1 MAG: hypothetical protein E5X88_00745 [Mesorhizobium sp.]TIO32803.1 MAG: hypothetical protein E5X89_17635 [Mesorhizobium sp.]
MPNTTVRAAAEGMPAANLNRRRLLMGLAAASTAAAAVTVAPAAHSAAVNENPEPVRLGNELPAAEAEMLAAKAAKSAVIAEWSPRWPLAPDEIIEHGCEIERNLTGAGLHRDGRKDCLRVGTANDFRWWKESLERQLASKRIKSEARRTHLRKEIKKTQRKISIAERYAAETARIREASGYEQASERHCAAIKALSSLIVAIMAQPGTSMQGVMIKAQALATWKKADRVYRVLNVDGFDWGSQLAASVIRMASEASS